MSHERRALRELTTTWETVLERLLDHPILISRRIQVVIVFFFFFSFLRDYCTFQVSKKNPPSTTNCTANCTGNLRELKNCPIIIGPTFRAHPTGSYITRFCTSQVHSLSRPSLSAPSFSIHSLSIVPPLSYYSLSSYRLRSIYVSLPLPRSISSAFCTRFTARFLARSSRTSLTADISPGHRIPRCLAHTITS